MAEFHSVTQLSALNGRNGFQISGEKEMDYSGASVASAGDINSDGLADVIIGAPGFDTRHRDTGASYVLFGSEGGFVPELLLSSLNGRNGFQITGEETFDLSGLSVASAGDVNGDGFDDFVIGAPFSRLNGIDSGVSYVVFGQAARFPANLQLSSLDGSNGFQVSGETFRNYSGRSVASAGDINGDGFDDVIIGAYGASPNGEHSGASYVIFGKAGGFAANLQLSSLKDSDGFQISGEAADDRSGFSVASAGDVNSDGFDDVIIGAPGADPHGSFSGASYVVFGKGEGFASNLDLSNLDGTNGFQISGRTEFENNGQSVASAGDVNGDGFNDVIIGAPGARPGGIFNQSGASYIVFGKASGFAANLQGSGLDGSSGFRIYGERLARAGESVATAGDINGDGFADVIIGGSGGTSVFDVHGGASYVVFGHRAFYAVNRVGTAHDDTINGGRGNDTIHGLGGNDRLIAWEGNDLVFGNGGRDRLSGRMGHDRLIGGAGPDVLFGGSGNDIFDFNAVTDSGTTEDMRDVIRDFTHLKDKIDLSDLGALTFIGTAAFTAPGQVRVVQQGPNTIVEINLSGDAAPEMTIALEDVAAALLTMQDFIL